MSDEMIVFPYDRGPFLLEGTRLTGWAVGKQTGPHTYAATATGFNTRAEAEAWRIAAIANPDMTGRPYEHDGLPKIGKYEMIDEIPPIATETEKHELHVWMWRNDDGDRRWSVGHKRQGGSEIYDAVAEGFVTEEDAQAWKAAESADFMVWKMPPWMVRHCNTMYLPSVARVLQLMNYYVEADYNPGGPKYAWANQMAGAVEMLTKLRALGLLKEENKDE